MATETITVQNGDDRIVVHLPISVPLLLVLMAGITARHPESKVIDTGRNDLLVFELGPEVDE